MKTWLLEKLNTAALITVLLTFLASCAPESKNFSSYQDSTNSSSTSDIVGGALASLEYQKQNGIVEISILTKDKSGQEGIATCTGTLISKNLVLTAAHCLADSGITTIAVVFTNDENTATKNDVRYGVDAVIHADFLKGIDPQAESGSANTWNDIALIKLDSDAPTDFKFARLPASSSAVKLLANSKVTLAGFGITNAVVRRIVKDQKGQQNVLDVASTGSGTLRKVDGITVKGMSSNQKEIILDQTKLKGACHGDSGGPAFINANDGQTVQVGITSRGTNKLGNCNENSIYTSVAAHLDWISENGSKLLANPTSAQVAAK